MGLYRFANRMNRPPRFTLPQVLWFSLREERNRGAAGIGGGSPAWLPEHLRGQRNRKPRSAAKESGDTEPEGAALALEREVRRSTPLKK